MSTTRRYRRSTEVDWTGPTHQTYREAGVGFDVRLVKAYLSAHPIPVRYAAARTLAVWMQAGPSRRRGRFAGRLDPSRLPRADPDIPLIFADTPRGAFLIDGHHRLERGRQAGYEAFPLVVLADREALMTATRALTSRARFWWVWRGTRARPGA